MAPWASVWCISMGPDPMGLIYNDTCFLISSFVVEAGGLSSFYIILIIFFLM